jgi:hypothetical protein
MKLDDVREASAVTATAASSVARVFSFARSGSLAHNKQMRRARTNHKLVLRLAHRRVAICGGDRKTQNPALLWLCRIRSGDGRSLPSPQIAGGNTNDINALHRTAVGGHARA